MPQPGPFLNNYQDVALFSDTTPVSDKNGPLDFYNTKIPEWKQKLEAMSSMVYGLSSESFDSELQLNRNDFQLYKIINKLNDMPLTYSATEKILTFVEEELTILEKLADVLFSKVEEFSSNKKTEDEKTLQSYRNSIKTLSQLSEELGNLQLNLLNKIASNTNSSGHNLESQALQQYSDQLVKYTDKFFNSLVAYRHSHKATFGWKFIE